MASGKKNYFRHSMNARNDHKLKTFMASFGRNWREGYFYFFSLLELCGNDARDGKTEHTFHINTLRELWGTSTKGAHEVCKLCTSSALVMCNIGTNHVTFSLPNLLNYTGQYEKKGSNKSNQSKLNEIKESTPSASPVLEIVEPKKSRKKNLPKTQSQGIRNTVLFEAEPLQLPEEISADELAVKVLQAFNVICFKSCQPTKFNLGKINARIKEGYSYEDFVTVIKFKNAEWKDSAQMRAHIVPGTFFCGKFDGYLQTAKSADKPIIDPLEEFLIESGFTPDMWKGEPA